MLHIASVTATGTKSAVSEGKQNQAADVPLNALRTGGVI